MKSIKPGRGPMMMGGVTSILIALFGLCWTVMAASMGAYFMIPFGMIFIAIAVIRAVYAFKNANSPNRYSSFDIVDSNEEPDPFNGRLDQNTDQSRRFCPSCGAKVDEGDRFCSNCGNGL